MVESLTDVASVVFLLTLRVVVPFVLTCGFCSLLRRVVPTAS